MPPSVRAVVIAAVSSPDQVRDSFGEERDSLPSQIRQARELIERRGWNEVAEPLIVPGHTRSIDWFHEAIEQIPAYARLRELADARKIDVVVCRAYNRLARTSALQQQVSAYLRQRKVQIYAIDTPTEIHDPASWQPRRDNSRLWIEAIAGAESEVQINQLWSYHRSGMEARTKKGQHPEGIPNYGYKDVVAPDGFGKSHKKRVPDEVEYPILKTILRMLLEGKTGVFVAKYLNAQLDNPNATRAPMLQRNGGQWTSPAIISLARNPFYGGKVARYRFDLGRDGKRVRKKARDLPGMLVDGVHEAPLTWDVWERLQEIISDRARWVPRLRRRDYLWSGMATCGFCLDRGKGYAMRYCHDHQTNQDGTVRHYRYLVCSRYSYSSGVYCQRNTITVDGFNQAVLDYLRRAIADPALLDAPRSRTVHPGDQDTALNLERVRAQRERLADEEKRWDHAYRAGVLPLEKYAEGLEELTQRRQQLEREEEALELAVDRERTVSFLADRRGAALARLAQLANLDVADPDVVGLIHQVIARVEVRGGDLRFIAY